MKTLNKNHYSTKKEFETNPHYRIDDKYNKNSDGSETDFVFFLIQQFESDTDFIKKVIVFDNVDKARYYYNETIQNGFQYNYYRCFETRMELFNNSIMKLKRRIDIEYLSSEHLAYYSIILLS